MECNTAFNKKNYQEAYNLYSSALLIDPTNKKYNSQLFYKRAKVLIKVDLISFAKE